MNENRLSLTDANKNYEEIMERTLHGETFVITRYGHETAVLMPFDEYTRLSEQSSGPMETSDDN